MSTIYTELQVFKMHPFILKRDVFLDPIKCLSEKCFTFLKLQWVTILFG
jgi:hypothetical protein